MHSLMCIMVATQLHFPAKANTSAPGHEKQRGVHLGTACLVQRPELPSTVQHVGQPHSSTPTIVLCSPQKNIKGLPLLKSTSVPHSIPPASSPKYVVSCPHIQNTLHRKNTHQNGHRGGRGGSAR